jgi:hypothetical protein
VPETLLISGLMNHVYEQRLRGPGASLKVPADARPGAVLPLTVEAQWLACTDQICVPESGTLQAEVKVGPRGVPDARFDAWRAALPAPLGAEARFANVGGRYRIGIPLPASVALESPHLFVSDASVVDYAAPQAFTRQADLLVVELPPAKFAPITPQTISGVLRLNTKGDGVSLTAVPGAVAAGGTPVGGTAESQGSQAPFALLILMALAGGLLLNVMPCVFPILSLKALSLARAGESEAQARAEGLAYTAGVMLACLGLGVLLLALRAAGEEVGWAFQLQEPLVVAALLLLAVAITANLLGVRIQRARFRQRWHRRRAPLPPGCWRPSPPRPAPGRSWQRRWARRCCCRWRRRWRCSPRWGWALPCRSSPSPMSRRCAAACRARARGWAGSARAMARADGADRLALVWLASRLAGSAFAFAAAAGNRDAERAGRARQAPAVMASPRRLAGSDAGSRAGPAVGALGLPGMSATASAKRLACLTSARSARPRWQRRGHQGGPVFVYITADWCLTCKVNERAAIEREDTQAAFEKAGVVVLRGDWTRRDPAITRYLTAQGAAGVPLYMWYPAGRPAPAIAAGADPGAAGGAGKGRLILPFTPAAQAPHPPGPSVPAP